MALIDDLVVTFDTAWNHFTDAEKQEVDELIRGMELWAPLKGPQYEASICDADELFYGGSAGGGKGLLNSEKIATPFGYREVGKLKRGDVVLAADGSHTKITGVYPQLLQKVFKVSFSDGASLVTDAAHRWNYSVARKGKWRKSGLAWKVDNTEGLMGLMQKGHRVLIPLVSPLKFTKTYRYDPQTLPPYLLGVMLGDGSMTANNLSITSADAATMDIIYAATDESEWSLYTSEGRCNHYYPRGRTRLEIISALTKLSLFGKTSVNKFVPECYKWGTIKDRTCLLQGLMDTDGTVDKEGKAYFTSISERLAKDVRWLVTSLGGRATITSRIPVCTNGANGVTEGKRAYTCYIRMPDNKVLFQLTRKRDRAGEYNGGGKTLKRRITSIEPCGEAETTCISVEHPSSLFIAGEDLIVSHNTDLIVGVSLTQHLKSIIYRREGTQQVEIIRRTKAILSGCPYQGPGMDKIITFTDAHKIERVLEFGAVKDPDDTEKYQGRPHDLKAFDEITHFLKTQYIYLNGWKRSAVVGQQVRTICTGNPPTRPEGRWVNHYWGPWLNRDHPLYKKVEPGELVWYWTNDEGEEQYTLHPEPMEIEVAGIIKTVMPKSRTFIPSSVTDNPYYSETGYVDQLNSLPEPLRSMLLHGDFQMAAEDDPYQVIPTDWIDQSMDRWKTYKDKHESDPLGPMDSMGLDCARGGRDSSVAVRRYGRFFDTVDVWPGRMTPDGPTLAGLAMGIRRNDAPIHVDVIGIGSSVYDFLRESGAHVVPINGAEGYHGTDLSGNLRFANFRAWMIWSMRETLDPKNGLNIMLPPDDDLRADLASYQFKLGTSGILIEDKQQIHKRIGRSPDKGDAVCYASIHTPKRDMTVTPTGATQNVGEYDPYA